MFHWSPKWYQQTHLNCVLMLNPVTLKIALLSISLEFTWWRHQMEIFSALLAICAGNSPVTGEFPAQRPVTRSFAVFFHLRLNKRLSKQSWGWWFETLSCPLWRHCNEMIWLYLSHCVHSESSPEADCGIERRNVNQSSKKSPLSRKKDPNIRYYLMEIFFDYRNIIGGMDLATENGTNEQTPKNGFASFKFQLVCIYIH